MTTYITEVTQEVQYLSPSKLRVREDNPRRITKARLKKLSENIKNNPDFFKARPILCDKNLRIFAGAQRLLGARRLKLKVVPVIIMDISEERQKELMLLDNVHGGVFDIPKLELLGSDLLLKVGLTKADIPELAFGTSHLQVHDDDFDETTERTKIKKPKTKLGDIIILGSHKIICADNTDPSVHKKLRVPELVSMIYQDPPYNLRGGVDYNKGFTSKARYGAKVHDNRSDEEFAEFLRKGLTNALSIAKPDVHVFTYCDEAYIWLVQTLYRELGIENKRVCLWIKNSQNPVPSVAFAKCFEACPYGVRGRPYLNRDIRDLNEVLNKEITTGNKLAGEALDQLNVWFERRLPGQSYEHATSKPPSLHQKAIRRCTRPNEIIFDNYLGSGSTLIAGEMLKRRVYGCELEPVFCDLIIRRWERLTGRKAKIIRV